MRMKYPSRMTASFRSHPQRALDPLWSDLKQLVQPFLALYLTHKTSLPSTLPSLISEVILTFLALKSFLTFCHPPLIHIVDPALQKSLRWTSFFVRNFHLHSFLFRNNSPSFDYISWLYGSWGLPLLWTACMTFIPFCFLYFAYFLLVESALNSHSPKDCQKNLLIKQSKCIRPDCQGKITCWQRIS